MSSLIKIKSSTWTLQFMKFLKNCRSNSYEQIASVILPPVGLQLLSAVILAHSVSAVMSAFFHAGCAAAVVPAGYLAAVISADFALFEKLIS